MAQVDHAALSSDLSNAPAPGTLECDATTTTLVAGYPLQGAQGKTFDLLGGARLLTLDNELQLGGIGTFQRACDITDGILVVRRIVPIAETTAIEAQVSYGRGDSEARRAFCPRLRFSSLTTGPVALAVA